VKESTAKEDSQDVDFKDLIFHHNQRINESLSALAKASRPVTLAHHSSTVKKEKTNKLMELLSKDRFGFDPISLMSIIFIPLLCAAYSIPLFLYIPISLLVLTYFQSQRNRIDRQIAVGIVTDPTLLRLINDEMPSWFHDSDFQRVEWINSMLEKIFPKIALGLEPVFKEIVQPALDENTPFYLPRLKLKHANLGSISPKLTGIRFYHSMDSNIRFDIEVKWAGDVQFTLTLNTKPLPITVELVDLRMTATIRVEIMEITTKLPCFRAISATCMTKPSLDFALKLASFDLMNMGAGPDLTIASIVRTIIDNAITGTALYPKRIIIPVDKNVDVENLADETPDGILIVHLMSGSNLMSVNLLGGSDPFVEFTASSDVKHPVKSSVKSGTVNPDWYETFQFFIYDKATEIVEVAVYDSDITNKMHTFMGKAVLRCDAMKRNSSKPQEFTLSLKEVDSGSLKVSCIYKSISKVKRGSDPNGTGEGDGSEHVLYEDEDDLADNEGLLNHESSLLDDFQEEDEEREEGLGDFDKDNNNNTNLDSQSFFQRNTFQGGERNTFSQGGISLASPGQTTTTSGGKFSSPFGHKGASDSSDGEKSTRSSILGRAFGRGHRSSQKNSSKRTASARSAAMSSEKKIEEFNRSVSSMVGVLNVSQIKLTNIKLANDGILGGESSLRLYVRFSIGNKRFETKYMKNNQNPHFVETFTFLINSLNEDLVVNVYNKTKYAISAPKSIGTITIPLLEIAKKKDEGGDHGDDGEAAKVRAIGKRQDSGIQRVEQRYMLNGLKEEAWINFRAVLSVFEN
jgi:hypothetical protein